MDNESLGGGVVGTLVVLTAGGVGKLLLTYVRGQSQRRKLTTEKELTRDERAFATQERRIEDLKEALRDVAGERDQLQAIVDRLRGERDAAKEAALDAKLHAKELDQRLRYAGHETDRRLQDCNDDLDEAREMLEKLTKREPE